MKKQVIDLLVSSPEVRFLLDSGAFTAWKAGNNIDLDEYCSFIENLPIKPWRYFSLDVIGDPEGSLKNYEKMISRGLNPIPIFTRGDEISMVDEYYKSSDILGIGGLVGTRGNKGFVKGLMKQIGSRKVHWLGFTDQNYVSYFKPYSCDSLSWSSSMRYAMIKIYKGRGGWIRNVKKADFMKQPTKEILDTLKYYDIDPIRFSKQSEWKNSGSGKYVIEEVAFKSWTRYMIDLDRIIGTKFFLAVAADMQLKLSIDAFKFWMDKNGK